MRFGAGASVWFRQSVNVDLIYGLPHQTTLASPVGRPHVDMRARPGRALLLAHVPDSGATSGRCPEDGCRRRGKSSPARNRPREVPGDAGYDFIGIDHFARPEDRWRRRPAAGTLHRNFHGVHSRGRVRLVGVGVSAVGSVGASYSQNVKELVGYFARAVAGELPVPRGAELADSNTDLRLVAPLLLPSCAISRWTRAR